MAQAGGKDASLLDALYRCSAWVEENLLTDGMPADVRAAGLPPIPTLPCPHS